MLLQICVTFTILQKPIHHELHQVLDGFFFLLFILLQAMA